MAISYNVAPMVLTGRPPRLRIGSHPMGPRRRPPAPSARTAGVAVALLATLVAGCSSGTAEDTSVTAAVPSVAQVTDSGPTTSPGVPSTTPAAAVATSVAPEAATPTTGAAPPAEPSTAPAPTDAPAVVPVTDPPLIGLPGAASDDLFCSVYGPLVVSVYLIGLSEAFATDPLEPRRVELAAGATVDYAYRSAVDLLPAELAADAEAFTSRWQPYADRAVLAMETVARSSLAGELFPERWTVVLTEHDRNDPAIDLGLDESAATTLNALVPDFAARVGPISQDLAVARGAGVATPLVDAHVARTCPDVASITAPDAV